MKVLSITVQGRIYWKKRASYCLALSINSYEQPHQYFLESQDHVQCIYEQARRNFLDCCCRSDAEIIHKLKAHGVTGLFLEPEQTILSGAVSAEVKFGNAFYHTHLNEDIFTMIACCLAEGVGIRSAARIAGVDKKTVMLVLDRVADHVAMISRSLMKDLSITECQLDEMWSFIGKKEKHLESLEEISGKLGDAWIWIAFDPVHKLMLAHVIGKRTEPYAVELLREVKRVTLKMLDLFTSDQLDQYANALLQVYGLSATPPRKPGPGRPPHPKLIPPDDLLYAQVVKTYKQNTLNKITRKVVFGDPEKIEKSCSVRWQVRKSIPRLSNVTMVLLDI
jgi:IS1 family transposase